VSIPADVEHGIRNAGDATLRMFYCLAADSFSDVEYCFSNAD
jgi:oxalate decarboxylase/phosphoglucose isomerase-like protein (cupin superfamily)